MPIGIIGAMDEEVALLKSLMTNKTEKTIANVTLIYGNLAEQEVVLLKSGIGKVNASIATTLLHEHYSPKLVINTGSAGGLKAGLNVGDIVISDEVVYHDVDATVFGYDLGQVPQMPKSFKSDSQLMLLIEESIQKNRLNSSRGMIVTGDSFLGKEAQVNQVKAKFKDAIAGEMEAAAIAQVCYQYGTPFVVIRALSDIAGEASSVSFDEFLPKAADNAAKIIVTTLTKLKSN